MSLNGLVVRRLLGVIDWSNIFDGFDVHTSATVVDALVVVVIVVDDGDDDHGDGAFASSDDDIAVLTV